MVNIIWTAVVIAVFSRMRGNKILERLTVKDSNTPHPCDYRYIFFILWLLGFSINIGGSLIHLLLVLALIGIVYNLFMGRSIT